MTQPAIVVLGTVKDGKAHLVAKANAEAVAEGAHAGKLVTAVAACCGCRGGGSATFGQGGGAASPEQVRGALHKLERIAEMQ